LENGVKLLMDERAFVGNHSQPDDRDAVVILGGDLGDRGVKSASQAFDDAFDDSPFILERVDARQGNLDD
jgi:hypothetical protein